MRGDECQAPPASLKQVPGCSPTSLLLGEPYRQHARLATQLHHVYAGHAAGNQHLPRSLAALETGEQDAARLVRQVIADQIFFFVDIVVIVADQHLEPAGAHHFVDGLQSVDEQLVGQRRNQHNHRLAARRSQRPGSGVGDIAKARCRGHHFFHQCRSHGADTAQGAGGCDRGNPGKPGHFCQSGSTGSAGA
ncbi:hypothetical protein D3C81_1554950 [compost metagenome]